jgi:hypothetical protein
MFKNGIPSALYTMSGEAKKISSNSFSPQPKRKRAQPRRPGGAAASYITAAEQQQQQLLAQPVCSAADV